MASWYKKIEYNCGLIPTILVQNKIDLLQHATVNRDEVNELSARLRLPLFLTSSKENINIENAFYFLAKSYIDSLNAANVIDTPAISSNKKLNNFLSNKPSQQNQHRKMPLRPVNNEHNIRLSKFEPSIWSFRELIEFFLSSSRRQFVQIKFKELLAGRKRIDHK